MPPVERLGGSSTYWERLSGGRPALRLVVTCRRSMDVDFREFIHEGLCRYGTIDEFMLGLIGAHEEVAPEWSWGPLRRVTFDETEALRTSWLVPCLARAASDRAVTAILVDFESGGWDDMWMVASGDMSRPRRSDRVNGLAHSRAVAALARACLEGERCPHHEARHVFVGYAAKATAEVLTAGCASLPWERRLEVVAAGLHIGRIDRDGFIPTPLSLARRRLRDARAQEEVWLRERGGPTLLPYAPYRTRDEGLHRLRHPDGRMWEAEVVEKSVHLRFTDGLGEVPARERVRDMRAFEDEVGVDLAAGGPECARQGARVGQEGCGGAAFACMQRLAEHWECSVEHWESRTPLPNGRGTKSAGDIRQRSRRSRPTHLRDLARHGAPRLMR